MAITKNIVDMMGGTIKVQTAQGKGTEFIICLPMRTQAEHRPVEKITELEGLKALLVEDNELNREIAVAILHEYGFLVDTAENGAVAVEKIRTSDPGRYDLVLMDVQMPVMDGCTATQRIRALKDPARAAVPIVAMTANVFEEERKRAFDCGMNGFLSKPIVIEELIDALRDIIH